MRFLSLLALGTLAAAQGSKNLTFTDPDPKKKLDLSQDSIEIRWTIPLESPYAPLNTTADLMIQGDSGDPNYPGWFGFRIKDLLSTGVGSTGQIWDLTTFKNYTRGWVYPAGARLSFRLDFKSIDGKQVVLREDSEKFDIEGVMLYYSAAEKTRVGWGVVGLAVGVVGLGMF